MSLARKVAAAAAVSMGLALATPAFAQFGGIKVPGLGGSSNSQSNVDVDSLLSQQSSLMKRFNGALGGMLVAQARTAAALDLKHVAEKAEAEARNYQSGNVMDKDQIERSVAFTESARKEIDQQLAKGAAMSAEGKKQLAAAVPHYARGVGEGVQLPPEFRKWATSVQSGVSGLSSNPAQAMKLKDGAAVGIYVAQKIPTLASAWTQTTKDFVNFAKKNEVEVSDLSDKLGKL